ncbi:hypothetical protein ACLB9X_17925 [Streptomyces sp. 5K101]|uniref:hypothetical protein n=1 Tax=Streptomyces sp. 5K101 TaxID=3390037 RepID=UPI00397648A5
MPNARAPHLTRRGVLAVGGALGLGVALAACGKDDAGSGGSGNGSAKDAGSWSFKDDRGTTAESKSVPKNIVAFTGTAAALYDYGIQVKGVFGPTRTRRASPMSRPVSAAKYDADIIVMDNRTGTLQPADLEKSKPTWAKLPAVKAGQVIPRVTEPVYSYAKCAPILEDLAKAIANAEKVS